MAPERPLRTLRSPCMQWPNFLILVGWALFYRILFFCTLKLKEARSK